MVTATQDSVPAVRLDAARLSRRVLAARVRAERLCYESASRLALAQELRRRSTTLRLEAAEICPRVVAALPTNLLSFSLLGFVAGARCTATWTPAAGLTGDPALLERAAIVADLGDSFARPGGAAPVLAALDGAPIAVLLTLVRACDRVVEVELTTPRST